MVLALISGMRISNDVVVLDAFFNCYRFRFICSCTGYLFVLKGLFSIIVSHNIISSAEQTGRLDHLSFI